MKDTKRRYTPGLEGVERVFDYLDKEERKSKQRKWLEEHKKENKKEEHK